GEVLAPPGLWLHCVPSPLQPHPASLVVPPEWIYTSNNQPNCRRRPAGEQPPAPSQTYRGPCAGTRTMPPMPPSHRAAVVRNETIEPWTRSVDWLRGDIVQSRGESRSHRDLPAAPT